MRILMLGIREFRANWRRNSVFGGILLVAVGVQMFAALSGVASRAAVSTYGTSAFGRAQTWTSTFERPLDGAGLSGLNGQFADLRRSYPWLVWATMVDLDMRVLPPGVSDPAASAVVNVRAASAGWAQISAAVPDDDAWRTVTSDARRWPGLLLDDATAARLKARPGDVVGILVVPDGEAASGNPAGILPPAVRDVPVFGRFQELNKALTADALGSQSLLESSGAGTGAVTVYWRCEPSRCRDALSLVQTAASAVSTKFSSPQRVDQLDQFLPVLAQQRDDGRRASFFVLALSAFSVAMVSTAFVEARTPQLVTLRTLGASRSGISLICLLENVLTSMVVAAAAVVLGVATTRVRPDLFNRIHQVRLTTLEVPVDVYVTIGVTTVAIGLLTGFLPALRAYRVVRAN
jgi:FtsX-like permease family